MRKVRGRRRVWERQMRKVRGRRLVRERQAGVQVRMRKVGGMRGCHGGELKQNWDCEGKG